MIRNALTIALLLLSAPLMNGCDSCPGPDSGSSSSMTEPGTGSDSDASEPSGSSGDELVGDGSVEDFGPCEIGADCQSGICKGDPKTSGNMCHPCVNNGKPDLSGEVCVFEPGDCDAGSECRPSPDGGAGYCTAICAI